MVDTSILGHKNLHIRNNSSFYYYYSQFASLGGAGWDRLGIILFREPCCYWRWIFGFCCLQTLFVNWNLCPVYTVQFLTLGLLSITFISFVTWKAIFGRRAFSIVRRLSEYILLWLTHVESCHNTYVLNRIVVKTPCFHFLVYSYFVLLSVVDVPWNEMEWTVDSSFCHQYRQYLIAANRTDAVLLKCVTFRQNVKFSTFYRRGNEGMTLWLMRMASHLFAA